MPRLHSGSQHASYCYADTRIELYDLLSCASQSIVRFHSQLAFPHRVTRQQLERRSYKFQLSVAHMLGADTWKSEVDIRTQHNLHIAAALIM